MAESTGKKIGQPPSGDSGGGLIGSIRRAEYALGQMLEATQRWADETAAQMERVTESAREAQEAAQDAIGASQSMEQGRPSSALTGPAGRTQASEVANVIGAVTNDLIQQAGRR